MSIPLANYKTELQQFQELVAFDSRQRILMFHGESGVGKSELLRACQSRVPQHIRLVSVQLRGSDTTPAGILYRLGQRGGWDRLPQLTQRVASMTKRQNGTGDESWRVNMRRQLSEVVSQGSIAERRQRLADLTEAWFSDLNGFRSPLLLVMDTFEQTTTEMQKWLDQHFLPGVAQVQQMRVLMAGRTVPEPSVEWHHCCTSHQLPGVHEAEAWLPVAEAMGRQIPGLEWMAGVCAALDGNPAQILQFIETLPATASPQQPPHRVRIDRVRLREQMHETFEISDLQLLCFDLYVEYENLAGDTKQSKVINLIKHMERHGRLPELLDKCRQMRPQVTW